MAFILDNTTMPKLTIIYPQEESSDGLLQAVAVYHAKALKLCKELEKLADSLPLEVDPVSCMAVAKTIVSDLSDAHDFEEHRFFPFVRQNLPGSPSVNELILNRLQSEHREDEGYAQEIAEVLADWAMCSDRCNAEATGYMLRGFFEGMRRHVWFEKVVLIDPIRGSLFRS